MIHLCYLQKKIPDQDEFYQQFLTAIFPYGRGNDLVITSEKISPKPGIRIFYWQEIDLETIYSIKTDNIYITEFDDIDSKFIRSLVTMKSKRTEIIGISNNYNDKYKELQLDIQQFREDGFTTDQISVALILKNNLPSSLVNECMNNTIHKIKNLNVKEIRTISEITKFLKV